MFQKLLDKFNYFFYFYKILKYKMFVSIILGIAVGILDGLGLAMFIPLLKVATEGGTSSENSKTTEGLLVIFNYLNIPVTLVSILLIMMFFFIFKSLFAFLESYLRVIYQQFFIKKIRNENAQLLSNLSYSAFVCEDIGKIQNVFTTEVERVNLACKFYFMAMQGFILVLVYLSMAYLTNPKFAILISIGGVLINFLFKNLYKKTKSHSKTLSSQNSEFQGSLIQLMQYFKYLRASGLIFSFTERLNGEVDRIESTNKKIGFLTSITNSLREPLVVFVVIVVIYIQLSIFKESFSVIVLSLIFFYRALSSLMSMQNNLNVFMSVSGSLANTEEFTSQLKQKGFEYNGSNSYSFDQQLELKNISLEIDEKTIIENLSLTINKNETIAFVGVSGSGKTTLVNIISGIIKPTKGNIYIDNQNFDDINIIDWQKKLGYITQEPVIFTDTIFNNITFWSEPTEENLNRFNDVVEMASLKEFIISLSNKENTILGNNGNNLSGGQRQRISIARELFKKTDVILMDEATSALDSETEEQIKASTELLYGKSTLIIIAHRLSTIKHADRIVLLDQGKIIAIGSFKELMVNSEVFNRMVQLQEF